MGMALSIPVMFFFPFVANLHDNIVLAWIVLMTLLLMRYCFSTSAFTSNNIMVSNSAPNDRLGRVNGKPKNIIPKLGNKINIMLLRTRAKCRSILAHDRTYLRWLAVRVVLVSRFALPVRLSSRVHINDDYCHL